jgi:ATP-binding cassette subfamily B protein
MQAMALWFPTLIRGITGMVGPEATASTTDIIIQGLLVFGVVILIFVINLFGEMFGAKAFASFQKNLRAEMFEKLQLAPVERVNELDSSTILPLIMNDTAWIRGMQRHIMLFLVIFPVAILGSIVMLFTLQVYYGLLALASLPLIVIFFFVNSRKINKIIQKSIPGFDIIHTQVKEGIIGAKEIRIFNKAKKRDEEYAEQFWYGRLQSAGTLKAHNLSASFNAALFSIITAAIVIIGAVTMQDVSQIGEITAALLYVGMLWGGSHEIFRLFADFLPRTKMAKDRIARIFNLPIDSNTGGTKLGADQLSNLDLEFKGISYKFANNVTGLSNINVKIAKNTRIAITGGAGSGRTIIPQLLLQYEKPLSGKITVGGMDIADINPTFYRKTIIAFCDQTPEFIPGTIRDNLAFLSPGITDEQILKLFKDIGAQSFVDKFDNFLDHQICERDGFNMATKKLLNLARTLLKSAHIYIFNQCFDHINPEYIVKIFAKLRREKKTCLFITQNNVVSKHCDLVYVLNKGAISGTGVHNDLVKNNADYREVFLASSARIISEEVAKEVQMVPEETEPTTGTDTVGGDTV